MLDKAVDEIVCDGGKLVGVRSGKDVAKADIVICDPTYAPDRCKKVGKVQFLNKLTMRLTNAHWNVGRW